MESKKSPWAGAVLSPFSCKEWDPEMAHLQGNWLTYVSKPRQNELWVLGIQWLSDVISDPGSSGFGSFGFIGPKADAL